MVDTLNTSIGGATENSMMGVIPSRISPWSTRGGLNVYPKRSSLFANGPNNANGVSGMGSNSYAFRVVLTAG